MSVKYPANISVVKKRPHDAPLWSRAKLILSGKDAWNAITRLDEAHAEANIKMWFIRTKKGYIVYTEETDMVRLVEELVRYKHYKVKMEATMWG